MSELKEQAQKHIDLIMKSSMHTNSEEFQNWVDEALDEEKDLVIETTLSNGERDIGCFTISEIAHNLDLGAEKHEVIGLLDDDADCDGCPWEHNCTF